MTPTEEVEASIRLIEQDYYNTGRPDHQLILELIDIVRVLHQRIAALERRT